MNTLFYYFQKYLKYLAEEKNYSKHTITVNRNSLNAFIQWCEEIGISRISDVTKKTLAAYKKYLTDYSKKNGDTLEVSTLQNRISKLRSFFSWVYRNGLILNNPAFDLELPKGESRLPRNVLTKKEAEKILNLPDTTTFLGIRDKAILETFYATGIRKSELLNLNVDDISFSRETIAIRKGKWNKDRVVPAGKRALYWLDKYITEVRCIFIKKFSSLASEFKAAKENKLFLGRWGSPLSGDTISGIVTDYIRKAKINKKASCHIFRHSMATHMLDNGADVRYVQEILGHVSIETTKIYTHVALDKLKEVHRLTHPAEREQIKPVVLKPRKDSRKQAPGNTVKEKAAKKKNANSSAKENANSKSNTQSLSSLVAEFIEDKQLQNYSKRTLGNYNYDLGFFTNWCKNNNIKNINKITLNTLKDYQAYTNTLTNKKTGEIISLKSRLNLLSSLRTFYEYLTKSGTILYNPAADLELPRTPRSLPVDVLTTEEIEKVLESIDLTNANGIRDRAIMELLYATGMRKEMNDLLVSDLDLENKTVLIREGKGKKDRYVPVSSRACGWIKRYLDVRPKCIEKQDYLFLADYGKKMYPMWLGYLVHQHVKKSGIKKSGSFLLFRHSVATILLENGADIRFIQQILGHVNLETTQIYTHVSIGKLKEVHEKTHPRAKLNKFLEEM